MVASSFIKIFSIVVLTALSVSAQRECPSVQSKDNNAEKKRFIVIFNKEVENAIEDHYETMKECYKIQNIIKANESTSTVFDQSVIRDFSVDGSIQGYTSYFTPEFAKEVGKMKNVELVEEERKVEKKLVKRKRKAEKYENFQRFSRRYDRRAEDDFVVRNIDRIDQAKRPLDGKFVFPDSAGEGVNIFIVDNGILLTHYEFEDRAKLGGSFCKGCGDLDLETEYHGTSIASIAAGTTIGVARKANIIDVRVFNDQQGSTANMIEGLSFVIDQHKNGKNKNSVVNMSIHVANSQALNSAVKEVTDAGIHMVVSAGDDTVDACSQSPASAPSAITVGSTEDDSDKVTDFSNYGKCIDIFAPGRNMLVAYTRCGKIICDYGYEVDDSTDYSSPLVAGALALLISKNGNKPPADLTKDLIDLSTKGVITGLSHGSPDAFLRTPAP